MSRAGTLPYHLRQNKAIDRNLFVDLLSRVGRWRNISDYTYLGFGGPFLEDYRVLHSELRIHRMISLEQDRSVFERQRYNCPLTCLDLVNESSDEYLQSRELDGPHIVWFDYTDSKYELRLTELQRLVEKLDEGDVFRISLQANPVSSVTRGPDFPARALEKINTLLGQYAPTNLSEDDVTETAFVPWLGMAAQKAAERAAEATNLIVQPLTAFYYADGQRMATFTAILLEPAQREQFFGATRLRSWPFFRDQWTDPIDISVPVLSVKERLAIESVLPLGDRSLADVVPFSHAIGNSNNTLLENFSRYYRHFPWYAKVVM